jgi:hypothetical protein
MCERVANEVNGALSRREERPFRLQAQRSGKALLCPGLMGTLTIIVENSSKLGINGQRWQHITRELVRLTFHVEHENTKPHI